MPGIVDIICSDIRVVGESDFVANSAVNEVTVNQVNANGLDFFAANGASKFQLGDKLLIKKLWCVVPFGFGQGGIVITTYMHRISIEWWDGTSLLVFPPFYGGLVIPTLCDAVDFGDGLYVEVNTTGPLRTIRLGTIRLNISQVNLPASLNGVRVPVQYYMEILHNLPMSF